LLSLSSKSSHLLPENAETDIYKATILLSLRGAHSLRLFENRERRRIFGPQGESDRRMETMNKGSFIICTLHHILGGQIKENQMERA
jgi:hypothetical protein